MQMVADHSEDATLYNIFRYFHFYIMQMVADHSEDATLHNAFTLLPL